ncbi:MAG: flagellar hook-basal body complex protein FliE [Planctomycetota bacterium]|nr:flagellar hook-basal body complex protein FliE [Planctomycetota bacterium]
MVDRIGQHGSLQREAILAAMRSQSASTNQVQAAAEAIAQAAGTPAERDAEAVRDGSFVQSLKDGFAVVEREIQVAEDLPRAMAMGEIEDFYEIAARIKRADLTFKFALEIRNKLIDAYREVMRMNV